MMRVSVEVREGTALSKATVQAESIREAVSITKGRHPGHHVRVMFPIDPEDFFVGGPECAEQKHTKNNHSEEAFCSTAFDTQGGA
jgi:hypothetical protein